MPIRVGLTLAFAGVMALVLVAVGAFVYSRFSSDLDAAIDTGLRSRASDVSALVYREEQSALREGRVDFVGGADSFAEVLSEEGEIEDFSTAVGDRVLLSPPELRRALHGPIFVDRGPLPGLASQSRLFAVPVEAGGTTRVVVVGASTEARADSLDYLLELLLIGGPIALLLASLAAYGVASAALRPVEAMRARAAEISAADPGGRLPVPPRSDEIARLGETLNEMLARLGAAIERERTFVADASHELRTPLAILRGELELALAEGRTPEELRAAIRAAAAETDRLTQLSNDLLTIAETERGELPLERARVDLEEVLGAVRRRFAGRAEAAGREIVLAGEPVAVPGDRLRLEQALGSIVDNALRYGGGRIVLAARAAEGVAEIRITDEGPGFPEEVRGRAFERFSRGSERRGDGGSGLGLAIVRTVARAHGGEVDAANRAAGGADVCMTLPLQRV